MRRKTTINAYKRKNWPRRWLHNFLFAESKIGHKKDYSWKENERDNPYKTKKTLSFRKKLEIVILAISLFGLAAILLYHPFFSIKNVEVSGLQRIDKDEFKDSVYGILEYRKFFIFPGKSYILADVDEIKNILKEKYPLQTIIVKKTFPQTIFIVLEEKLSTIIYDNGQKYGYLGLDGNIVEIVGNVMDDEWEQTFKITTTTLADGTIRSEEELIKKEHRPAIDRVMAEFGDYPIVYDTRGKIIEANQPALKSEIVLGAINWFNHLNKRTNIPFGYIVIENELGEGTIITREDWNLRVDLSGRFEEQIDELDILLNKKINRLGLNYIDLRYPGRIYWK